ncbi:hypothetical protein M422DRAFT_75141 [Sphaerobolus stellatus SS14]|uniref:Unplaced genomic scaffold SPHSTscaffold_38, whole genome shotgun sequence n=1 Tax=Sphaerobolus stellatus (strain SS14) TaxID=990650 RepID=A0A0C9VDD9_SPHS4|nr:hypothetical protein M422DRAFT_75141 [Sphaerobolus stellatus SS14]
MADATLSRENAVALSIFASYFIIIVSLFYLIISSIRKNAVSQKDRSGVWVWSGLAVASFGFTWYWMFIFMIWSFHDHERKVSTEALKHTILERMTSWLTNTDLFKQACAIVCSSPLNWWWSEQLCLFTAGAFTIFLYIHRERVPHTWAYMLLGQVLAISVAWCLFNLALVLVPWHPGQERTQKQLPLSLTVPVLLSFLTISLSPYTTELSFLPNLLIMHALLIVPLVPPFSRIRSSPLSPKTTSFYTLVALLALLLRIRTLSKTLYFLQVTSSPFFSWRHPRDAIVILWNAPGVLFGAALGMLHSHPAQASIGWDIIWTSIGWLCWCLCGDRNPDAQWSTTETVRNLFPTIVASVGVTAPMEIGHQLREKSSVKEEAPLKEE